MSFRTLLVHFHILPDLSLPTSCPQWNCLKLTFTTYSMVLLFQCCLVSWFSCSNVVLYHGFPVPVLSCIMVFLFQCCLVSWFSSNVVLYHGFPPMFTCIMVFLFRCCLVSWFSCSNVVLYHGFPVPMFTCIMVFLFRCCLVSWFSFSRDILCSMIVLFQSYPVL